MRLSLSISVSGFVCLSLPLSVSDSLHAVAVAPVGGEWVQSVLLLFTTSLCRH